jgi:C-8 sterol isomerase
MYGAKIIGGSIVARSVGRAVLVGRCCQGMQQFNSSSIAHTDDKLQSRFYIFDHKEIQQLVNDSIQLYPNSTAGVIHSIVTTLREKHGPNLISSDPFPDARPDHQDISPVSPYPSQWLFSNAGGSMGSIMVIHASITEYLLVFGTPLGTEGHSGRHTADDYLTIIEGEQWACFPHSLEMERYPKGSQHYLPRGTAKQIKMHRGGWAIELAQGWIPPMLPFGVADTLFSTLDFPGFAGTLWLTGKLMVKSLLAGKM